MPLSSPLTFSFSSPSSALEALLALIHPVPTESIPLASAPGRILAQSITADRPSPAIDMSSMDGYALRLADLTTSELPIAGEVRIGREPPVLPPNACLRIVTGAAIPLHADCVIKREDVTEHPDRILLPRALRATSGQNIRRAGENLRAGDLILHGGQPITLPIAAALATVGLSAPLVHRRIRLAILTTGDEVIPPDQRPTPWQLRDSNAAALRTLFAPLPFVELTHAHIADDAAAMNAAVASALLTADVLLCTGGVSMGHRDFVSDAIAASGARILFHGLPQRPGKPVLAAITSDGRPILALPGNPVSVMVTARRLALPALQARAGLRPRATNTPSLDPATEPPSSSSSQSSSYSHSSFPVSLSNPDSLSLPLYHHRLVKLTTPGHAELLPSKSSGDIPAAALSHGFIEVSPHHTGPGPFPFYPWT